MMQALLADRFKLVTHRESKLLPAFALVVAKSGPKMQKAEHGGPNIDGKKTNFTGRGMTMADLAETLTVTGHVICRQCPQAIYRQVSQIPFGVG
jgi:uncharacterized protein (TIGR03435 family)